MLVMYILLKQLVLSCTDVEFECPVLKVVHNTANENFTKNGVMVKGTIVEVDSNPFKNWLVTLDFWLILVLISTFTVTKRKKEKMG